MEKIPSGVFGLNDLLYGGINKNSTSVVIGTSGAGKTTFALQFIMRGLETGEDGLFITLDENQKQIINEANAMGWKGINRFLDEGKLMFIDASGEQFARFIREELPGLITKWKGIDARIVIDPLTPVIWAVEDRYHQRDLLSFLLREVRQIGTVVCTLEEHGMAGNLQGEETVIPMYLSDSVIHLRYLTQGDKVERKIKVIKCRSSKHSELAHQYRIVEGLGIIIHDPSTDPKEIKSKPIHVDEGLEEKLEHLPGPIAKRIKVAFGRLTSKDLEGLPPKHLISYIEREYAKRGQ